jgi:flagellar motility protein MotE (MotC chaperone)
MMFPSSRLLPLTIAAIVAVIAVKSTALVRFAPTMSALRSGAAQALLAAGDTATTSVIGRANAAVADAPPAAPPRPPARGEQPAAAATSPATPPGLAAEAAAAPSDPLKLRRSQLEERERQVIQRETLLSATDKRLGDRIAELVALQARLQALDSGLKQRDEANWAGLVKLYEGMRPHEAAAIFNALEKPVLLEILDRMKPAKAAPVIATMEAEKARQITADLAARRTRAVTATN